jgi:molecular chaperone GrpE
MKKQKHNAEEPEKEVVNDTAQQEQEANQQTENQTTEEEGDKIANEIAELTQKCNDLNDKNLRLMAEFDNYRKRTLKERSDLIKTAGENILSSMLPLVDDFERALKAMETAEDGVDGKEGVELIYNKFIAFCFRME